MAPTNPYCEALGIQAPSLEAAKNSPDANCYSLLIVALLGRGEPITLQEAARRFEEAGVTTVDRALASLKRCKPGRPPLYRDGDLYALDPHDDETDLWAFRLGLRPPKAAALRVVRQDPGPLPSPHDPLTVAHLGEAWLDGVPSNWSAQRVAICVLDAYGAPMQPHEVVAFVAARSQWSTKLCALPSSCQRQCDRRGAHRTSDIQREPEPVVSPCGDKGPTNEEVETSQ